MRLHLIPIPLSNPESSQDILQFYCSVSLNGHTETERKP
jgi:hypothetical protein